MCILLSKSLQQHNVNSLYAKVSLFYLHRWVDFSPVTYTHWGPGEPNNANGEEQCVQMNRHQGIEINQATEATEICLIYCARLLNHPVGDIYNQLGLVQVDGTMPTVVELEQVMSVRSSPEMSTPLLHPHSPGKATAQQVAPTFYIKM